MVDPETTRERTSSAEPSKPQKDRATLHLNVAESDLGLTLGERMEFRREIVRQVIATAASGAIALITILPFITLWIIHDYKFDDLKEIMHILIPPYVGIFGAVAGFYFGERNMG